MRERSEGGDSTVVEGGVSGRLQNGLFILAFVLAGLLLVFFIVWRMVWAAPATGEFYVSLTSAAMMVWAGLVGALLVALAFTVVGRPRRSLSLVMLGFALLPLFWGGSWSDVTAVVAITGMVALALGTFSSFRKGRAPRISVKLLAAITAVVCAVSSLGLWLENELDVWGEGRTVVVSERPNGGEWRLVAVEAHWDEADVDGWVYIERDYMGIAYRSRDILRGPGPLPQIEWIDERTLSIDGRPFDIFTDPYIDGHAEVAE